MKYWNTIGRTNILYEWEQKQTSGDGGCHLPLICKLSEYEYQIFCDIRLVCHGEMTSSGSIQRMENEAVKTIMYGQVETLRISVYGFEGNKIIEETPVLAVRKVKDSIIIVNILLKEENKE